VRGMASLIFESSIVRTEEKELYLSKFEIASGLCNQVFLYSKDCGHQYRHHKTNIASAASAITAVAS
jgi:hypothetical protein